MTAPTLADFLLARIAEDEADADAEDREYANTFLLPTIDSDHQARWSTDRVRAECQSKRRVIHLCLECGDPMNQDDIYHLLAQPYSSHPDFREEWRA